jgi:hypothetical protein
MKVHEWKASPVSRFRARASIVGGQGGAETTQRGSWKAAIVSAAPKPAQRTESTRRQGADRSNAPGQYLGYGIQVWRTLKALLGCRAGDVVTTMELIDEVAFTHADGAVTAEQVKSSLVGNPIADRALDLWKTLANWVRKMEDVALPLGRTRFFLFGQQPRTPGAIAQRFHEARTRAEAREALTLTRLELWGPAPEHARRKDVPESLATHVDRFLGADEDVVLALIERFDLAVGTGDPEAEIMAALERHPLAVSSRVPVCEDLLGWLKRKIDRQIAAGAAALVSHEDFTVDTSLPHARSTALALRSRRPLVSRPTRRSSASSCLASWSTSSRSSTPTNATSEVPSRSSCALQLNDPSGARPARSTRRCGGADVSQRCAARRMDSGALGARGRCHPPRVLAMRFQLKDVVLWPP